MTLDVSKYGGSTFWSDYQSALRNGNSSLATQYERIISDPAQTQANQDFRQALIREGMLHNSPDAALLTQTQVDQYSIGVANNTPLVAGDVGFSGELSPTDQAARLAWNNFRLSGSHGHIFDQALPTNTNGTPFATLQSALGGASTARATNISTSVARAADVLLAAINTSSTKA